MPRPARATQQIADGFTEGQQFFIAIGQGDCTKSRPEEIKCLLTIDGHAPHPANTCGVW